MNRQDPAQQATAQYVRALEDLRAARARYVTARVPMDLVDGHPPVWTSDQHQAVVGYYRAWERMVRARQAVGETGAARH